MKPKAGVLIGTKPSEVIMLDLDGDSRTYYLPSMPSRKRLDRLMAHQVREGKASLDIVQIFGQDYVEITIL